MDKIPSDSSVAKSLFSGVHQVFQVSRLCCLEHILEYLEVEALSNVLCDISTGFLLLFP